MSSKKSRIHRGLCYPVEITLSLQTLMNNLQAHVLFTLYDPNCKIEERIKTEIKNIFFSVPLQQWQQPSKNRAGSHFFFKWNNHPWDIRYTRSNQGYWIWTLRKQDDFILRFTSPPF